MTKHIALARLTELQNTLALIDSKFLDTLEVCAEMIASTFRRGNKVLICGNGGSAADAQHFAGEFVSSFSRTINRASLPAVALSTNTSVITAFANDFDFNGIFARQVEGLGKAGDVIIVLSTSGNSKNCINAIMKAKTMNLVTVAMTGDSGDLLNIADHSIIVPSSDTQRIQEVHVFSYHTICEIVEKILFE
jgi:D-sedoheptulose 7-phosphate isomerase